MILNEIPQLETDKEGGYKYILVTVEDHANNHKEAIFGNKAKPYHSDLFREFKKKYGNSFMYTCTGGGYLNINQKDKKITIHGESTAYGPANIERVMNILRTEYQNYELIER